MEDHRAGRPYTPLRTSGTSGPGPKGPGLAVPEVLTPMRGPPPRTLRSQKSEFPVPGNSIFWLLRAGVDRSQNAFACRLPGGGSLLFWLRSPGRLAGAPVLWDRHRPGGSKSGRHRRPGFRSGPKGPDLQARRLKPPKILRSLDGRHALVFRPAGGRPSHVRMDSLCIRPGRKSRILSVIFCGPPRIHGPDLKVRGRGVQVSRNSD